MWAPFNIRTLPKDRASTPQALIISLADKHRMLRFRRSTWKSRILREKTRMEKRKFTRL